MVSLKQKARAGAQEQLRSLLAFAQAKARTNPKASRDAVRVAVRLAQKLRKRLPRQTKRQFCRKCFTFFVPGHSVMVRVGKSRVAYHCLHCKAITRLPYLREQRAK